MEVRENKVGNQGSPLWPVFVGPPLWASLKLTRRSGLVQPGKEMRLRGKEKR